MAANENDFSFPANVEADEALTIIQSNEFLGAKMALLPKVSRQLFSYIFYYIGKATSNFIDNFGIDEWNKSAKEVLDYNIDLQPLYNLPIVQETYGDRGIHKMFMDAAQSLVETSVTFVSDDGTEKTIAACISKIKMDLVSKNSCTVSVNREIVSMVVPELIKLNDINESHKLSIVQTFGFKSKYAEKLYIFINGKIQAAEYHSMPQPYVRSSIAFLKKLFGLDGNKTYSSNSKFNERILYPALEEVNNVSDLTAKCRAVRDGRCIRYIEFFDVKRKGDSDVVVNLEVLQEKENETIKTQVESNPSSIDKEAFVKEAEKEGFTITQILDLFMHYEGNTERLQMAKEAYEAVCKIGITPAGDKFTFFMNLS